MKLYRDMINGVLAMNYGGLFLMVEAASRKLCIPVRCPLCFFGAEANPGIFSEGLPIIIRKI